MMSHVRIGKIKKELKKQKLKMWEIFLKSGCEKAKTEKLKKKKKKKKKGKMCRSF